MENKKLINWLGLTGLLALISYAAAVVFAPMAYPGYDWMSQAVSDLSAESAPSRALWNQLAMVYNYCNVVCVTCVAIYVSENRVSSRLFRLGIYLFAIMNWVSAIGYGMFPLADGGKDIASFQEVMHIVVTVAVVMLSIASLAVLIVCGIRKLGVPGIGIWAAVAFVMMMAGAMGQGMVPPEYFGIFERFSVFAAVGFTAVLGWYLYAGFGLTEQKFIRRSVSVSSLLASQ